MRKRKCSERLFNACRNVYSFGDTKVVCSASVEEGVLPFLKGKGQGWVTAEYGMLPRSCTQRINRDKNNGRTQEIQRLVGRSLRSVVDIKSWANARSRWIAMLFRGMANPDGIYYRRLYRFGASSSKNPKEGRIQESPLTRQVAAVSVGMAKGQALLDLNYIEDSQAEVDMNIVMLDNGKFVEIQGTAEQEPFSEKDMTAMLALAKKGIMALFAVQHQVLQQKRGKRS